MGFAVSKYILLLAIFIGFGSFANSQERQVPDSVVKKMQQDRDFRYANDSSYWRKEEVKSGNNFLERFINALSQSAFLKIILYLVLVAGIVFAVYQVMMANNFFTFSRRRKKSGNKSANEEEDVLEHLDEKLADAIYAHNYRLAVRYLYLKTLKNLSDRQIIVLNAKSTNKDYVTQMSGHRSRNDFSNLTRIYEYVWYGEFTPNEMQFNVINRNFNEFNIER